MPIEDLITISDISREDFGTLCICAVRYCLGRKTYMPSNVQRIISTNIKSISDKDLNVIYADIKKYGGPLQEASSYGHSVDYADWITFLNEIKYEINNQDSEYYVNDEVRTNDKLRQN